jgi:hypothetical protein
MDIPKSTAWLWVAEAAARAQTGERLTSCRSTRVRGDSARRALGETAAVGGPGKGAESLARFQNVPVFNSTH